MIHIHDTKANKHLQINLQDLTFAIELKKNGLPRCQMSTGELGAMYSIGLTSSNQTTTHEDKCYLKLTVLWSILPLVCHFITPILFFFVPKIVWKFVYVCHMIGVYGLGFVGDAYGSTPSIVISRDMGNATHIDPNNMGPSCAIWFELNPGMAKK